MKENILGYSVDALSLSECIGSIIESLDSSKKAMWLACLNPHSYVVALKDKPFSTALKSANWLIPDGIGIVYASKIMGGNILQRVTGPDIYTALHEEINRAGGFRVFFLGGSDQTVSLIEKRMRVDYPRIEVVGTFSPPFKEIFSSQDIEEMINAVNAANADILWVGLSAPKQEKWIYDNRQNINVRFVGAVGAVFDFYAGTVRRSPPIFRKIGLEWLPRLLQQPRRLWRRMFISAPIFIWHVMKTWANNKLF